jgi:RNA polymerase sigma-70 factor (ECF subfamily)
MNSEATLPLRAIVSAVDTPEDSLGIKQAGECSPEAVPANNVSDESLLSAAAGGSRDAIGQLFHRHGATVLNVARRILHDESEAADLRQEVFLYLFQRAKLYDPRKSSAVSWIMQITYHRAFDRRRFLTARQHYKVEELDEQRTESFASHLSTDQLDGKRVLERLKEQLTREQHETLELHLFQGYTFQEIAARSGQTVGNVRHYYYRGLERLRANLISKKRG